MLLGSELSKKRTVDRFGRKVIRGTRAQPMHRRAELIKARAVAEAQGDKIYIAAWDERMGVITFTLPDLTKALPAHLKANLKQRDLDDFRNRFMVATAELQAAQVYDKNRSFYDKYKETNDAPGARNQIGKGQPK